MSLNQNICNTDGLRKFALIVRAARGDMNPRAFAQPTKIARSTIWRWESMDIRVTPSYANLEKLSPFTSYSAAHLQSIILGKEDDLMEPHIQSFRTAEDVLFYAEQLSDAQMIQLMEMLCQTLKKRMK